MDIEPRHLFFFIFLAVTLTIMAGIGDGVMSGPNQGVVHNLVSGDLSQRLMAVWNILNVNYDWLNAWVAWPFRIINWIVAFLIMRAIWKLMPIIGR